MPEIHHRIIAGQIHSPFRELYLDWYPFLYSLEWYEMPDLEFVQEQAFRSYEHDRVFQLGKIPEMLCLHNSYGQIPGVFPWKD